MIRPVLGVVSGFWSVFGHFALFWCEKYFGGEEAQEAREETADIIKRARLPRAWNARCHTDTICGGFRPRVLVKRGAGGGGGFTARTGGGPGLLCHQGEGARGGEDHRELSIG